MNFLTAAAARFRTNPDKYLLASLVFLLPFERIPSYPLHGVNIRLSFFAGAALILRAIYLIWQRRIPFPNSLPFKLVLVFLAWNVVLIPLAINHTRALEVVVFTAFTIAIAGAVMVLLRRDYLPLLLRALLISAAVVLVFSIYQYLGNLAGLPDWITGLRPQYSWQQFGFPRIQSTALEPLYFASYLLLPAGFLIGLILLKARDQLARRRWPLIALSVALSTAIFLTVSRGGILAFIAEALFLIAATFWWRLTSWRKAGAIVGLLIVGFGLSLICINFLNKPPKNFGLTGGQRGARAFTHQLQTTGLEGGGDQRAQTRRMAIDIIKQSSLHVLIGTGPGQFGPIVQNNQPGGGWWIVNNEPLELWVEVGLVGLVLLLIFVAVLLVQALRRLTGERDRQLQLWLLALVGFVVAIAVQYQTFSTLYIVHIWTALGAQR